MRWQDQLGRWPLLIAALAFIGLGMSFDVAAADTEETRAFLLALGAVTLGAWIALLAAAHYRGADDTPEQSGPQLDPSATVSPSVMEGDDR